MKVCVMMFYLHCCSIIIGMFANPGLIDRTASDMPRVRG